LIRKLPNDLRSYTQDYFEANEHSLKQTYPGLSLYRLFQFLEEYGINRHLVMDSFYDQVFYQGEHNPLYEFFLKLDEGIPLEYITGHAFFYKSEFKVTLDVLIPRSETEVLVERAAQWIADKQKARPLARLSVCDVGVGSGAILLSLMRESQAPLDTVGVDICPRALEIAKQNAYLLRFTRHQLSSLELVQADRLNGLKQTFDLIVSNPPYIPMSDGLVDAHSQVLKYEPMKALCIDDDKYNDWFLTFFAQAFRLLKSDGAFMMEGYELRLPSLKSLLHDQGFDNCEILKDLTGRDRFLIATKKRETNGSASH
jgi:release factor glutamine methyltransferase